MDDQKKTSKKKYALAVILVAIAAYPDAKDIAIWLMTLVILGFLFVDYIADKIIDIIIVARGGTIIKNLEGDDEK